MEQSHGRIRILVIDDEQDIREMLRRILANRGFDVVLAENGLRAQELAAEQAFDLALCDVIMPELDGIATLAWFKTLRPQTEVVMMSGYAPPGSIEEAQRLGAYAFLQKPFDIDDLVSTLAEAVKQRGRRAQQPQAAPA